MMTMMKSSMMKLRMKSCLKNNNDDETSLPCGASRWLMEGDNASNLAGLGSGTRKESTSSPSTSRPRPRLVEVVEGP